MSEFWQDPQLNELVREINESEETFAKRTKRTPVETVPAESSAALEDLLRQVSERDATDLLIIPASPPIMRVNGELVPMGSAILDADDVAQLFASHLQGRRREQLEATGCVDFSIRQKSDTRGRRFRVNLHRQRGHLAAALRCLPAEIPTFESLSLPPTLAQLGEPTAGLVLVCGPTGAGKSSTLAAIVNDINRRSSRHIVTIEDPIEYEHTNVRSVIEQIEVGVDAPSFPAALRSSLRQNPDVILVGEMRDLETIATAVSAAETGHLVLATLHTSDAIQAVHRIIDAFPPAQQAQIRHQLAVSLNAILSQQLIPRADRKGRVPALELLLTTDAVRNHIRSDRLQNIPSEITLGKRIGMISFEESLAGLVRSGAVRPEEARVRSRRPDDLESFLRG